LAEPTLPRRRPNGVHRHPRGEVEIGLEPVDVGVDLLTAGGDRERQALVAVLDEVGVVDLDQADRQVDDPGVRGTLPDHRSEARRPWAEAAVEVLGPVDGPDDRRDRHFPATDREPGLETEPAMDLVECEEVLAVAASERALRHRVGVRWSGWWPA